ncbi:MAG: YfiR family protein [Proteobacteria bacterium]|uniref:YfiR family protein n=1 Tax=Rudaea sp. TaxID=2136325 RepID=UPI001DFB751B|nr:YfiR family protein [Pseudomonadota bacterium]MBS0567607.1 YfiR family protein [Pseudomonadota bacterium]
MINRFSPSACLIRITAWAAAALSCAGIACGAEAQTDGLSNSAEYITGFVHYVHWQGEDRLPAWTVCIVGDVPVEQDRVYAGRIVRGKPFAIHRIDAEAALNNCQVLDLSAADAATTDKLLARVRRQPILAVGSGSGFCTAGGQICLHLGGAPAAEQQKFEVNISAMREAALVVSSRLLTLGSSRTAGKDTP